MGPTQETINTAKQLYGLPWISSELKKALENDFPELVESENEKIRTRLIALVEAFGQGKYKDEMLVYLEKQKEQKPLMYDGEIEDTKRDIVAAIRKYYPADYAEYLTSFLKGLSPEDNSEDEYGQEMLGIAYKLMYEHIPENLRTQEFWDSLKFMREYTGRVAIIHSYEKPAEWSDEDEKMIDKCIELVLCAMPANISAIKTKEQCIVWLKSLRPQPHWKPSKKQMAVLEIVCKYEGAFTQGQLSTLLDLKEQLKKL